MQVERLRPTQIRLTLHVAEYAALVAAARWFAEGAQGELPPEAVGQITHVLVSLDAAQQAQPKELGEPRARPVE